jgi:hypothetical protein
VHRPAAPVEPVAPAGQPALEPVSIIAEPIARRKVQPQAA